ncbi:MAG: 2-hydroxychromene-2-carboxylate isomerase [Polyangiales bacterium]
MPTEIRFLFDLVSPYAYLASTQVRALGARHGREVVAVPVLFAALVDASGAQGPAEIPAKREYMYRDVNRLAAALDVPINPPATHPFNPLAALRASHAVDDMAVRWRLVDALFRAAWVDERRIDQPDDVACVATAVGLDGNELATRAAATEAKRALRAATDAAIADGVFGVPTMIVDGELFWGVDSLHLLDRFLSGETIDADRLARWRAIAPSAERRAKG